MADQNEKGTHDARKPREMITMAERRFPVRVRITVRARRFRAALYEDHRVARRELRTEGWV